MCVSACVYVYMCIYVVCVSVRAHVCVSSCVRLYVAAIQTCSCDLNSTMRWFRFVPIMDPIQWRFKDRPIRWSGDPYRFVQWRPDDDSNSKPRHFMWVFVYWSILISTFYLIVSCECIYDFCIILFIPTIIVIPCTLILFYWYIIYCVTNNVIDSFRYSWQMNIGHDFPY